VEIVVGVVILWIIPIFVAEAIGRGKRRAGFLYGLYWAGSACSSSRFFLRGRS